MGFNKRRMESGRVAKAAKEAEARRALGRRIAEDAERLVAAWNVRSLADLAGRTLHCRTLEAGAVERCGRANR
jgi:hypothetical protein